MIGILMPIVFVGFALALEYLGLLSKFQILGLFFDVLGAYYLAMGYIVKGLNEVIAGMHGDVSGDMPTDLVKSFMHQKMEAITGLVLLILGFLLQGLGVVYSDFRFPSFLSFFVVCIFLVLINCVHWRSRPMINTAVDAAENQ